MFSHLFAAREYVKIQYHTLLCAQWCVRHTAYGTGWLGGLSSIIACNNTMYLLVYFHPYNVFSLYHFDSWAHFFVFTATPKLLLSFLFVRFSLSFLLSFVFNYFYSVDRSVPTWCVSVPIKRKTKQMPTVSIWSSWSNMKQSNTTTERNGNIKCVCVCRFWFLYCRWVFRLICLISCWHFGAVYSVTQHLLRSTYVYSVDFHFWLVAGGRVRLFWTLHKVDLSAQVHIICVFLVFPFILSFLRLFCAFFSFFFVLSVYVSL